MQANEEATPGPFVVASTNAHKAHPPANRSTDRWPGTVTTGATVSAESRRHTSESSVSATLAAHAPTENTPYAAKPVVGSAKDSPPTVKVALSKETVRVSVEFQQPEACSSVAAT